MKHSSQEQIKCMGLLQGRPEPGAVGICRTLQSKDHPNNTLNTTKLNLNGNIQNSMMRDVAHKLLGSWHLSSANAAGKRDSTETPNPSCIVNIRPHSSSPAMSDPLRREGISDNLKEQVEAFGEN